MEGLLQALGFAALSAAALAGLSVILLWVFPPLRNTMTNLLMRAVATVAAGLYALSPIDLIPDFIPVLGQLDDVGVILLLVFYWLSLFKNTGTPIEQRPASEQVIDIKPVD